MMKCPMCGAQNKNGTMFCKMCGSNMAVQPAAEPGLETKEITKPAGKLSAGVIVAIAVAATILIAASVLTLVLLLNRHSALNNHPAAATSASTEVTTTEPTTSVAVAVPNVAGMKVSDAVRHLEELGLKAEKEFEESDTVPKDYIIRQSVSADRSLNRGDAVMLVVSSGKPAQSSQQSSRQSSQSAAQPTPTPKKTFDVESEVAQIRVDYYATQDDPGTETTVNGITYYSKNGATTKIVCPNGTAGWGYSREYFFKNGKLYFAFIFDGTIEHRLYFADDTLIRYIDDDSVTHDYGGIQCPFEQKALAEAYQLL